MNGIPRAQDELSRPGVSARDKYAGLIVGRPDDGAQGLLEMKDARAFTIAQDKQSCVVFGMSREAIARGAVCRTVDLHQIAPTILDQLRGGRSAATRA